MGDQQFRRDERIEAKNLVSYELYDSSGNIIEEGMAVTLNISRSGALLKVKKPFPSNAQLGLIVAIENDIVEVESVTRHCEPAEDGDYNVGVKFVAITEEQIQQLAKHFPEILG
ncbi:MAG: hypothetical protein Kow00108_26060 [Calditrichia bacterium]